MYNYTNGFNCLTKDGGNEIVIIFVQEGPSFDGDGKAGKATREHVSSLVMHTDTASALRDALIELLGNGESNG